MGTDPLFPQSYQLQRKQNEEIWDMGAAGDK